MFPIISFFKDRWFKKLPYGVSRSSGWPKVRKLYLLSHPYCECCGGKKKLEVHHKKPVWLFPELELDFKNLKTLCEQRGCHLAIGHLYFYRSYNPNIDADIIIWKQKIIERP